MSDPPNFDLSGLAAALDGWLEDHDYAMRLISDLDWESQLRAIRSLLRRNKVASERSSTNIEELQAFTEKATGGAHDHAVDLWVDALHDSVYDDAATSMASVGMFAPLIESIFFQAFSTLGSLYSNHKRQPPAHKRWSRAGGNSGRWDCHFYYRSDGARQENVPQGIRQLSEASGLAPHLPPETFSTVESLLTYRNRMFHLGFEWPETDRTLFKSLIAEKKWEGFFTQASRNYEPWIFYLSESLVDSLPDFTMSVLSGIGRFAKSLPNDLYID